MKTQKVLFFVLVLVFTSTMSFAQPGFGIGGTKLESGELGVLKGQTSINVIFSYENLMVGAQTEDAYIQFKTKEQNTLKPGSGADWSVKWKEDKTKRYEPEFMKAFNLAIKKMGIVATSIEGDNTTKYTLVVKVIKIEPGLYTGVSVGGGNVGQDTYVDINVSLVETANPSIGIALISLKQIVGTSVAFSNYDTGLRITNSFSNAGKELAKLILKKCK